jgi:hypothetical protein
MRWQDLSWWERFKWTVGEYFYGTGTILLALGHLLLVAVLLIAAAAISGVLGGLFRLLLRAILGG